MKASKSSPVGRATIIGLGGIGRQVALQLATLGMPRLQLVDAGVVTRRTQLREGYVYDDIGRPKVHAAAQACHQLNPKLEIHSVAETLSARPRPRRRHVPLSRVGGGPTCTPTADR